MPRTLESAGATSQESIFVGTLLSLFPRIVYTVNQTLETASHGVSKRAGVVLWSIYLSGKVDRGRYLETRDITAALKEWFAVKSTTANQSSNQARKELFEKDLIITREAPKRIYLTEKGEEFCINMLGRVRTQIEQLFTGLNPEERQGLMEVLKRTLGNGDTKRG